MRGRAIASQLHVPCPSPRFRCPRRARATDGVLDAIVGGERVALHAERALHWPRERTVFVADVHLGKAAAFRAGGVPLPRGSTAADLARLTRLIERTSAARLVVLGDFLHAKPAASRRSPTRSSRGAARHATIDVVLVRGNHDARAGDPPADWNVRCVDEPYALPPFLACHMTSRRPAAMRCAGTCTPACAFTAAAASRRGCRASSSAPARDPAGVRALHGARRIRARRERAIVVVAGGALFTLPPRSMTMS